MRNPIAVGVSLVLTDGTTSFTLILPGPSVLPVPFGSASNTNFSSSADSGQVSLQFAAHKTLTVSVLQGDPQDSSSGACVATATSVTVQYHTED